jgi:hypothetical protein
MAIRLRVNANISLVVLQVYLLQTSLFLRYEVLTAMTVEFSHEDGSNMFLRNGGIYL